MSHGLNFLDVLLIASVPMLIVGAYYAYLTWCDDHPRDHGRHHPAE